MPGPSPSQPPAPPSAPPRTPFDRSRFLRLLAMYVFGVAIGCVLVGLMLNAKKHFRPPAPAPAQTTPATPPPNPATTPDHKP